VGAYNLVGDYDPLAPAFTAEEVEKALAMRQRHCRHTPGRADCCPHARRCADDLEDCIERICWYLRHQHAIEARLREEADESW